jgi:ubiquinone/menaquinone biosynthesis C-methylase UbiE
MTQQQAPDWGDGAYEAFSNELAPAAAHLVDVAAPQEGERVVDLGCGDGNATILLAAGGASVTAVDPSARLLQLAVGRCARGGHEIAWAQGAAEALPLPDASAQLVLSNFGVIFSADAPAAISEVLRVLEPGGRFVYSAWRPAGGIYEAGQLMRQVLREQVPGDGDPPPGPPAWHEPHEWLAELVPGGAAAITVHEGTLDFVAESGAAWLAQQSAVHPMWLAARRVLGDEPRWLELMERSAALLDAHSTLPEAMIVPSPYVVVEVHPQ